MTTAVVVFDGAIDALGGGALVVNQIIRIGHVDGAAGLAFGGDFGLQHGVTAGVGGGGRAAGRRPGIGGGGGGVGGGGPDVVETEEALFGPSGGRGGGPAVVGRGG